MTPDEKQKIIDEAVARETERCATICGRGKRGALQPLANFIALETNLPTEAALAILDVGSALSDDPVNAEIARQALAELAAHIDQTLSQKKERSHE